eukprot:gb/GEZN01010458.1/.p1 GENE.gb/GEZN01010458.1/~~gb/GEZN01010458.1/.p1  ORF type:complete len:286 (+),score=32.20 gb/GEZN01010458.1/:83-940(+)
MSGRSNHRQSSNQTNYNYNDNRRRSNNRPNDSRRGSTQRGSNDEYYNSDSQRSSRGAQRSRTPPRRHRRDDNDEDSSWLPDSSRRAAEPALSPKKSKKKGQREVSFVEEEEGGTGAKKTKKKNKYTPVWDGPLHVDFLGSTMLYQINANQIGSVPITGGARQAQGDGLAAALLSRPFQLTGIDNAEFLIQFKRCVKDSDYMVIERDIKNEAKKPQNRDSEGLPDMYKGTIAVFSKVYWGAKPLYDLLTKMENVVSASRSTSLTAAQIDAHLWASGLSSYWLPTVM